MTGGVKAVVLASLVWTSLLAGTAAGQAPGSLPDIVTEEGTVECDRGLYCYRWNSGLYQKELLHCPIGGRPMLDLDNESVLAWSGHTRESVGYVLRVTPRGVVQTIFKTPWGFQMGGFHQSGDFLGLNLSTAGYYDLSTYGPDGTPRKRIGRWGSGPCGWYAYADIVVDLDSGDYLVYEVVSGSCSHILYRVTESGTVTIVLPGPSAPPFWAQAGWDQDAGTGELYGLAWFGWPQYPYGPPNVQGSWWARFRLDPVVLPTVVLSMQGLQSPLRVHEGQRLIGLHRSQGLPEQWSVVVLPLGGGQPVLYPAYPARQMRSLGDLQWPIELIGRRKLAGRGPATPGSEYELLLHFPGEAGVAYQVAASLAPRPGITVGSRTIPLFPDALFVQSLANPAIFSGFAGSLDGSARATARVRIPAIPGLRGVRFFLAAVTYGPGGLRKVSNPIGVTVL